MDFEPIPIISRASIWHAFKEDTKINPGLYAIPSQWLEDNGLQQAHNYYAVVNKRKFLMLKLKYGI